MAVARTADRGLSTDELQTIRDTLAAGRRPKVQFTESAGQVAGQTGQVVELTDPAVSDDWVVVRFGRDELPFSPTDLSIPPRGGARRAEPRPGAQVTEPEFLVTRTPVPPARKPAAAASAAAGGPPAAADCPAAAAPAAGDASSGEAAATGVKPARRAARTKAPAGLTVSLSYADGDWTVSAVQGGKAVAKPSPVRPAEALRMVALVDVPGLREAVEQIMAAERSAAEQQAEALRTRLAEIEARLVELRGVG